MASRLDVLKLAGAGLALPLVTGGMTRPLTPRFPSEPTLAEIPQLMRRLGYARIVDKKNGLVYHATGKIEGITPNIAICYENCQPTYQEIAYTIVYSGGFFNSEYNWAGQLIYQGFSPDVNTSFYNFVPSTGSTYWLYAQKALRQCAGEVAAASVQAYNVARYIVANAGTFSANVGNSAKAALKSWGGTGLGIAASADFIGAVIASVTVGQWLLIAGAVGLTALFVYAVLNCAVAGA